MKEVSAGIIIYRKTKEGPRFLILYHGGRYWNFPKGKLSEGEKSFRAALREVWEETGIGERDLRFKDWFRIQDHFMFTRDKQKIFKTVTYYLAETATTRVRLQEVDEEKSGERAYGYGWFTYQEALRVLMHRNLRSILKRAYNVILQRKSLPGGEKNPPRESRHVPVDRPQNK